jgi:class 3 adenylate cyclase/tetratricopeptide (TPR) repeat protein
MKCPRCQTENPPQAKFCLECAAPLARTCSSCGTLLPPTAKFCLECAHPVTGPGLTPSQPRFGSPEAYTPRHLAEKILTSKAALEGERKQVTVLFADLKGSMELLADRDPEEARKLLDPVLERMMEAVHRYEGTVNQVMGDGIMALFGAPLAHEDHAVRACYAALDMQAALRRYAEEIRRTHGVDVQVRVGLNSGEVVVRAIGSDLRVDYSAVGQTTHLAARMEQLARPGVTLLTADTLRLAEGYVEVTPLGPVPLKGLVDPLPVYELAGLGLVRSRLGAAAARGLTRFVGRDAELEQLRQALGHAGAGHGQLVAIVGEPGVGKSRLVWEVTHSHRTHGWLVLHAGSVSYGKATTYLPVIDLLKGYFAIEDRDGPRALQEKMTGKLLTLDRALESSLPALLALLDVPIDDPQWATLDPPQRRRRTLDAVRRLLLRESQGQPLLVVFEDLHWIDSETQALLEGLVESLPTARVLLLVNYRPEYRHDWGSRTYYTQLRLDPLPPESAEQLLAALQGSSADLEPLTRLLIAQTEGNPFFLEESVRTLVETGVLVGERGAYRLVRPLPAIQVPATVQAVLAARIDRLSPGDKTLLQTASVIGKDVPFALLQAVAEQSEDEVHAALGRLQAAEFLYEARLFPDLEYTFKHALTHDVAYGSLLQDRRRALHRRITEAIERLYPDRLVQHVERLAYHAFRGELKEKAVTYLRQAGAKATSRCAYREVVACLEQALAALGPAPDSREMRELAIDLRFELRLALTPLGEYQRALDYLHEAQTLAMDLGDRYRLGWAVENMTFPLQMLGEHERAMEVGRQALAIADELQDVRLQADSRYHVSLLYFDRGEYRRAIELLQWSVEALQGDLIRHGAPSVGSVSSRSRLAWCHAELGEYPEATMTVTDGVRIAEAIGQPYSRVNAYCHAGIVHLHKGDLPQAIRWLEPALALVTSDFPFWRQAIVPPLGLAYALTGRTSDALALARDALDQLAWIGPIRRVGAIQLAEIHLLAGAPDEANRIAVKAVEVFHGSGERGREAEIYRLLGAIALASHPPDQERAEARYRQALILATELGMRPLVAHCYLGLGKLYRSTGNQQDAQEHLATATTMYRDMGMTFWLEKAEAELGAAP